MFDGATSTKPLLSFFLRYIVKNVIVREKAEKVEKEWSLARELVPKETVNGSRKRER